MRFYHSIYCWCCCRRRRYCWNWMRKSFIWVEYVFRRTLSRFMLFSLHRVWSHTRTHKHDTHHIIPRSSCHSKKCLTSILLSCKVAVDQHRTTHIHYTCLDSKISPVNVWTCKINSTFDHFFPISFCLSNVWLKTTSRNLETKIEAALYLHTWFSLKIWANIFKEIAIQIHEHTHTCMVFLCLHFMVLN